jgi:hypothetical protein
MCNSKKRSALRGEEVEKSLHCHRNANCQPQGPVSIATHCGKTTIASQLQGCKPIAMPTVHRKAPCQSQGPLSSRPRHGNQSQCQLFIARPPVDRNAHCSSQGPLSIAGPTVIATQAWQSIAMPTVHRCCSCGCCCVCCCG